MKYFRIVCLLSFCLTTFLVAEAQQQGQEITVPLSVENKKGKLRISIKKGPIAIKGTARRDVLVRYRSTDGNELKMTDAGNGLKKITGGLAGLEIVEREGHVQIKSDSWQRGVDIYVEVPAEFDLDVQTYNDGKVTIENVSGEIEVQSYNGSITATGISGSLVANTYNGPIVATFNRVTPDTPMSMTTYNGKIDLTFPAGVQANLKLKSEQGEIYTGFDLQLKQPETKSDKPSSGGWQKTFVGGWITGVLNGGGPEFVLKNYNGDIYIRKQ